MIKIKRIYGTFEQEDGFRILIDRLWPRGLSKKEAKIDLWLKEIAPSTKLRQWFNHDPLKWVEFKVRYKSELDKNNELVEQIRELEKEHNKITLLYSAHDQIHNDAVVLYDYLK